MSLDARGAMLLATWLSPSYPVGAYAYSHGLEQAVEAGTVRDAAALRAWLEAALRQGAGRSDAVLLAAAWRDPEDEAPADLAQALQPSAERRLEAMAQGQAFSTVTGAVRGHSAAPAAYCVALGRAARRESLPLAETCAAFLHAFASNLVSAAIRLSVVGQTEAQGVIAALAPVCEAVAAEAIAADPDDVGGACLAVDLASMLHETQGVRLFRS